MALYVVDPASLGTAGEYRPRPAVRPPRGPRRRGPRSLVARSLVRSGRPAEVVAEVATRTGAVRRLACERSTCRATPGAVIGRRCRGPGPLRDAGPGVGGGRLRPSSRIGAVAVHRSGPPRVHPLLQGVVRHPLGPRPEPGAAEVLDPAARGRPGPRGGPGRAGVPRRPGPGRRACTGWPRGSTPATATPRHGTCPGPPRDLPPVADLRWGTLSPRTVATAVGDATPGWAAFCTASRPGGTGTPPVPRTPGARPPRHETEQYDELSQQRRCIALRRQHCKYCLRWCR